MSAMLRDVRHASRALRASPGFTLAAVATMAIGIGATAGIFSIFKAVLLRPFPFDGADRLVAVGSVRLDAPGALRTVSLDELRDWQRQSGSIAACFGWRDWGMSRHVGGEREGVFAAIVTPEIFQVLPVRPVLGRLFEPGDDRPGRNAVVLLSHGYWRERFGGDAKVIGQTLVLERGPVAAYTVIGVLPPELNELTSFEGVRLFALSSIDPDATAGRAARNRRVFARLSPDASIEDARSEMAVIAQRLARQYPETNEGWSATATPLVDDQVGPMGGTLRAFLGAVGFVLLIACANVAALQLARALARRREFSIRTALGGSRLTIVRALALESALLSAAGGAAGLVAARWLVDVVLAAGPAIPRAEGLRFDLSVFAFALGVCAAAALVLALPASMLTTRLDLVRALKEESGQVANASALRARMAFVAVQVALAVMLLSGAVGAGRTLVRHLTVDPGFDPAGVAMVQVFTPLDKYKKGEQVSALYDRLLGEIRAIPGVRAASAVSAAPLSGEGAEPFEFTIDGSARGAADRLTANYFNVAPAYFRTIGTPVLRGRDFTADDTASSPPVAIVNEAFVRRFLAGRDPLGSRIQLSPTEDAVSVVGVAGDLLQTLGPRALPEPEAYVPYAQRPRWATFVVVRADDPGAAMAAVRHRVRQLEPDSRVGTPLLVSERIARSARAPRFVLLLFGLFAGVALLLSAIGVYGLVSYAFAQRVREIGVRISLGATPRDILRLVMASGFAAVLTGSAIGLLGTAAVARLLGAALPQLEPLRPWSAIVAFALLVGVGWAACYIPARRALRIDPVDALRSA
jgi:putative ABC transport system permease protein